LRSHGEEPIRDACLSEKVRTRDASACNVSDDPSPAFKLQASSFNLQSLPTNSLLILVLFLFSPPSRRTSRRYQTSSCCFDRGKPPEADSSPKCGTWCCVELVRAYFRFLSLPTYRVRLFECPAALDPPPPGSDTHFYSAFVVHVHVTKSLRQRGHVMGVLCMSGWCEPGHDTNE
jgi:hypothetical protein